MDPGRSYAKTAGALAAAVFCCALLAGCVKSAVPVSRTGFAMGSLVTAGVYAPQAQADEALSAVMNAVSAADTRLSATLPESEIYKLNEAGEAALSPETAALLNETKDLCVSLAGRLDITLGAVTALWGFAGDTPRLPTGEEIVEALRTKGLEALRITENTAVLGSGMRLDLGAVGKGAGCDAACTALREYGAPAVLSLGGTVLLYGPRPGGAWCVGVRDPFGTVNEYFATLTLQPAENGAYYISTSGSYEKTFTENGKTYHHILDPETGYPVETALISVTAVGESGIVSDALSTALFVNGLNETSLSWVNRYLTGAAFVFADGRVYVTGGLKNAFSLQDTGRFRITENFE